jgi:hypothetical protein
VNPRCVSLIVTAWFGRQLRTLKKLSYWRRWSVPFAEGRLVYGLSGWGAVLEGGGQRRGPAFSLAVIVQQCHLLCIVMLIPIGCLMNLTGFDVTEHRGQVQIIFFTGVGPSRRYFCGSAWNASSFRCNTEGDQRLSSARQANFFRSVCKLVRI